MKNAAEMMIERWKKEEATPEALRLFEVIQEEQGNKPYWEEFALSFIQADRERGGK